MWSISIHGYQLVESKCWCYLTYLVLFVPKLLELLLDQCSVCVGHPDPVYVQMVEAKKVKLISKDYERISTFADDYDYDVYDGVEIRMRSIRVKVCIWP